MLQQDLCIDAQWIRIKSGFDLSSGS